MGKEIEGLNDNCLERQKVNRFTPRLLEHGHWLRLHLNLSDEDYKKIHPRKRWRGTVVDLLTGKEYKIRTGAACGLPGCHCDAVAERL